VKENVVIFVGGMSTGISSLRAKNMQSEKERGIKIIVDESSTTKKSISEIIQEESTFKITANPIAFEPKYYHEPKSGKQKRRERRALSRKKRF